jgi:hypothetical protein
LVNLCETTWPNGSWVSSVSVVSDYRLDDEAFEVWSQAEAKGFFLKPCCIQTSSGTHPASCPVGTGGVHSLGVMRGWGVTLTSHPHLVLSLWMSVSSTFLPPVPSWCVVGLLYRLFGTISEKTYLHTCCCESRKSHLL